MRASRPLLLASLGCAALSAWCAPAPAAEMLRVCLDRKATAPLPGHGHGLDYRMAEAVAERLGRTFAVQWFETETDRDNNPVAQVNALLSDGRCQVAGGLPLVASSIGAPPAERSRLPGFDGARPEDRRRWVPLNRLIASRAYRFEPLVVVLGPAMAGRPVNSLHDLQSARLGAEEGTLADAILMSFGGGALIGRIEHVAPGAGLLDRLEQGDFDATLVELHRLDEYRASHPDSKLSSSGHFHSIGFNIGFIGLEREAELMAAIDAAIGDLLTKDRLPALAKAEGASYVPPRPPDVLAAIPPAALRQD